MSSMKIGDRVVWLEAMNKGGWAGDGAGTIAGYDPERKYFRGATRGDSEHAPTGPAVLLKLDAKGFEVWVSPGEIAPIGLEGSVAAP